MSVGESFFKSDVITVGNGNMEVVRKFLRDLVSEDEVSGLKDVGFSGS